jgi:hypothetical protein
VPPGRRCKAQPEPAPCWPTTVTAVPPGAGGGPRREWLASLPLPAASREVVHDGLALTDALQVPIGRLDGEIRQRARSDPRVASSACG